MGVTWFGTSTEGPETDMALNTNFTWPETAGNFNAQTVFLHENGHVFGAGHSTVPDAVMEAIYGGQRLTLEDDDKRAIAFLYPDPSYTGSISGTVTDNSVPPVAIAGATISIETTPVFVVSDDDGIYLLDEVPMIGMYDVTATASGFASATETPVSVVMTGTTVDFALVPDEGDGSGGECVKKGPLGRNCK